MTVVKTLIEYKSIIHIFGTTGQIQIKRFLHQHLFNHEASHNAQRKV